MGQPVPSHRAVRPRARVWYAKDLHDFNPESVDLAELARVVRKASGGAVEGEVVGRSILRDEVVRHLGCSQLEGETLVDTMITRGFVVRVRPPDGPVLWEIPAR